MSYGYEKFQRRFSFAQYGSINKKNAGVIVAAQNRSRRVSEMLEKISQCLTLEGSRFQRISPFLIFSPPACGAMGLIAGYEAGGPTWLVICRTLTGADSLGQYQIRCFGPLVPSAAWGSHESRYILSLIGQVLWLPG